MSSKEEIEKRVHDEAALACTKWFGSPPSEDADATMVRVMRPLVERVIDLEELGQREASARMRAEQMATSLEGLARDERERSAAKLAAAEARGDDLVAALHNMTAARDQIGAQMIRDGQEIARLADKLKSAEARVIELDRHTLAINAELSRFAADLTEARAELRTAAREHDETTAALRAQLAALQGVIDGHEQAIRDACADEREAFAAERLAAKLRHNKLADTIVRLETTVDVLAGRLAQRGGG